MPRRRLCTSEKKTMEKRKGKHDMSHAQHTQDPRTSHTRTNTSVTQPAADTRPWRCQYHSDIDDYDVIDGIGIESSPYPHLDDYHLADNRCIRCMGVYSTLAEPNCRWCHLTSIAIMLHEAPPTEAHTAYTTRANAPHELYAPTNNERLQHAHTETHRQAPPYLELATHTSKQSTPHA